MAGRWQTVTGGPEETRLLGCRLGRLARPGLVVLLSGELGAGKTCLAQGVAAGLAVPADIPVTSPSYALLNIHPGRLPFYHFDLYRLDRVENLEELGYDEVAGEGGVTLVEWADRLSAPLPASLRIALARIDELRREVLFEALDAEGQRLLGSLAGTWNTL